MALAFSKPRCSPIAIDFGADSLKVLQVVPNDPPQLIAAASAPVPEHARTDVTARVAFFTESLRNLLKLESFKGKRAILSMPAYQTLVQHMDLAPGQDEDLEAQVGLQLQTRLNVDPARMVIRHFDSGKVTRNGSTRREVVCIAAPKETVMRYIDIAHKCKLDVVGMHTEPQAILKAFQHAESDTANTCFVDIGGATTKVVIGREGRVAFAKSVHAAGDQITRRYASSRNLSFADARQVRMSGQPEPLAATAAMAPSFGGSTAGATMTEAAIASVAPQTQDKPDEDPAAEVVECLVDELQMSLRHWDSVQPDRPINKLVFIGGESRQVELCQAIARGVRTAAQLGDPFARMMRLGQSKKTTGLDLDQPQPGWAVPFGLCLSEANL